MRILTLKFIAGFDLNPTEPSQGLRLEERPVQHLQQASLLWGDGTVDGLLYSQRSPCVEDNGDNAALHMPSPEVEGELTGAAVARGGRARRRRRTRVTGGGRSGER